MRECFTPKRFSRDVQLVVDQANDILESYARQGYRMTLRQLYYQFVARDLMANRQANYNRLGRIVSEARLAGALDWSHLADRTREAEGLWHGVDPELDGYLEEAAGRYHIDLWQGQPYRVEVWVEKQALVDVVSRTVRRYRGTTFACKGYVSQSEMYEAAQRMQEYRQDGHEPVILHLGDHDPSGIDMTRDIRDRLELLSYGEVEVRRIALNMDQVEQYGPPPNPAKLTDSRVQDYIARYGTESWELDALDPATLDQLLRDNIDPLLDAGMFNARLRLEQERQDRLIELAQGL